MEASKGEKGGFRGLFFPFLSSVSNASGVQSPPSLHHPPRSNPFTELPFSSEPLPTPSFPEGNKTCPFKVKSLDPNKPQISYVPWTKDRLQARVKEFPKVTQDPCLLKNLTGLFQLTTPVSKICISLAMCLLVRTRPNAG